MTLVRWQATVQNNAGGAVVNPSVTVRKASDNSLANIFDDAGSAKANPFIGTSEGFVSFRANPGEYIIQGASGAENAPDWRVTLGAGFNNGFATRAALIAALSWQWPVGSIASDGTVQYEYLGTGTVIPDMPGWVPYGDVTPDHWAANTTPGTTDMTTAIQAAINYVGGLSGGGTVRLRDTNYFVSATITISTNDTNLIGAGETATELRRSGDYGNTILVTGNDATGALIFRNEVSGIQFRSLGLTTSGAHIRWNGTFISRMQNVYFREGFIGARFSGATNVHVENVRAVWSNLFGGVATGRRFFLFDSAAITYAHPSSGDVFIDSFNIRTNGDVPNVEVGVEIQSADGIWFQNGHYGGASVANLWLNAVDANAHIGLVFHDNVMFDANEGDGVRFSGSAQLGRNIYFYGCNCKGGGLGKNGINIVSGATFNNVQWGGGFIAEYNERGIFINSADFKNADFTDIQVRGNSYTTTNTFSGINVAAGDMIRFSGGVSGGGNLFLTSKTQQYGIVIGASASNVTVTDMNLSNNLTGPSLVNGLAVNALLVNCRSDASRDVASASTINPPAELDYFTVTGTTATPNMIARPAGSRITLRFADAVAISGSGNIKMAGATVTRAGQVMSFVSDGTNWYPMAGSEILSSGENANGRWVRYANGWQTCSLRATVNAAITSAMLGGFRSAGYSWTYPQPFRTGETPVVTGSPGTLTAFGVGFNGAGPTSASYIFTAVTSQGTAADLVANLKAEGFWL